MGLHLTAYLPTRTYLVASQRNRVDYPTHVPTQSLGQVLPGQGSDKVAAMFFRKSEVVETVGTFVQSGPSIPLAIGVL